ncbi:protogenin B-like [Patiria miniata]|uniref:Uncharacterized protein n=1 Tax=Patiria miniata TaxID=46514 RepID=A0A914BPL4_PATMI|nr:protogenin B-like [Patiria miniata]
MIIRPLFGGFVVQLWVAVSVLVVFDKECEAIPELYFTVLPSSITVRRGESAVLPCAASGDQPINISWRRGREALPGRYGETQVLPNGSLALHFSEEEPACTKKGFQCCATNPNGTLCGPAVSVRSTEPPSKPVIIPSDVTVVQNGSIRLECQSTTPRPHPFLWEKDGEELGQDERYTLLPTGVLQITPAYPEDAGEYRCITGNPATLLTTSESSGVTVVAEPSVSEGQDETGSQGERDLILRQLEDVTMGTPVDLLVLECLAAGSWVDIQWSRNGPEPLPLGRSRFMGSKNLEMRDLTPEDSGVYACEATDTGTGETARRSATVQIVDYTAPHFTMRPISQTAPYFTTTRLSCSAEGNPPPQIHWYLNGEPIKTRLISQEVGSDNLVIWNVDREHAGIYQCVASNTAGTVQTSALLTVKVPLNIPDPPYNLTTYTIDSSQIMIKWQADEGVSLFSLHYYMEPDGEETQIVMAEEHSKTYTVKDLVPYTNYTFYMRAFTTKASGISDRVLGQTAEGVPSIAPEFSLISSHANTVVVQWEQITSIALSKGHISKYRICYQESGLPRVYTCREVGSSESNFTIRGLKPSTVYDIHMAASTSKGFGPESDVQSIRTTDNGNCSVPVMFPLVATVTLNETGIALSWAAQSEASEVPVLGFQLTFSRATHDEILSLLAESRGYVFSDLVPGEQYIMELIPYNECGTGPASTAIVAMPTITGSTYPPPENVRATSLSSTSIQLNWEPVQGVSRAYYKVVYFQNSDRRKDGSKDVYSTNTYVVLDDLKPFTIYALQVRIHQTGIVSQFSDLVYCRTQEDVPSAPVDFIAKPLDPHTVSMEWRPPLNPNGVIQAYNIMYLPYTQQADGQEDLHWNRTRKKGTVTSSTIRNLTSDTRYYFFLRACTSVGEGKPSTVLEVKTPRETNLDVNTGTSNNPDEPSATEKGLFIGILLGTLCIVFCTVLAGIRYKRYHNTHKKKMAARMSGHSGHNGRRVPVSRLSRSNSVEMAMTSFSPMLPGEVPTRQPNGQVHCESPLLSLRQPREFPAPETLSADEHGELPQVNKQQQQQQQNRHTLPSTSDSGVELPPMRHGLPACSTSLTESASEDGTGSSCRWTPLRESTSGDSGLIGDVEFSAETSPDFIEKVLREYNIGVQQV